MIKSKGQKGQLSIAELESELINYEGPDKIISSCEMLEKVRLSARKEIHFKTALPSLDKVLGGFNGGELTIISGPTGNGKTLLAQSFTRQFNYAGNYSTWFTYELPAEYFLKTFGDNLPVFYMPAELQINALSWLERRILEAKLKFDARAVFVDHLHFLVDMRSKNNMSLEIGHTMRRLKIMALKHNVCFFLIAHTGKTKPEAEMELDDLRDSSFVAQEADNVIMIKRNPEGREANLKVLKNRKRGEYAKIQLIRNQSNFLVEMDDFNGGENGTY